MDGIKLPFAPKELIEFFDEYCERHGIVDKYKRRRIWWAMFYCAKEGCVWKDFHSVEV